MVTIVPEVPVVGVKESIYGAVVITNVIGDLANPAAVVTVKNPPLAFRGTTALITVSEITVKEAGMESSNLTAVAPVKYLPLIVVV
jgi:hypothetical protein